MKNSQTTTITSVSTHDDYERARRRVNALLNSTTRDAQAEIDMLSDEMDAFEERVRERYPEWEPRIPSTYYKADALIYTMRQ